MKPALQLVTMLAVSLTATGADWYASPFGTWGAAGTIANPFSIDKALDVTSPAAAGDTIYLRGGYYALPTGLESHVAGAAGSPVRVRAYGSEVPRLVALEAANTPLVVIGNYTEFYGLDLSNAAATNRSLDLGIGVSIQGTGTKIINCSIHDCGIGLWAIDAASPYEVCGNVIWAYGDESVGWLAKKHGIYVHSGVAGARIRDNIILPGWGRGIQCYSELGEPLSNFTVDGNTVVDSGIMNSNPIYKPLFNYAMGGTTPMTNLVMAYDYGYYSSGSQKNLYLGFQTDPGYSATVSSNYFSGGGEAVNIWTNLTLTANTFANQVGWFDYSPNGTTPVSVTWDGNSYYQMTLGWRVDLVIKTFATWKVATGFDATSSDSGSNPAATVSFVRLNPYESGRANVTVFNWANTDNVAVDVSTAMPVGSTYEIRNAANFFGPLVKSGTYGGGLVSLPMTNLTVATPLGASAPAATGKAFNVFVLRSTPSSAVLVRAKNLRIKNARIN